MINFSNLCPICCSIWFVFCSDPNIWFSGRRGRRIQDSRSLVVESQTICFLTWPKSTRMDPSMYFGCFPEETSNVGPSISLMGIVFRNHLNQWSTLRSPASIGVEQEHLLLEYMDIFSKENTYSNYALLLLIDLKIYQREFDKVFSRSSHIHSGTLVLVYIMDMTAYICDHNQFDRLRRFKPFIHTRLWNSLMHLYLKIIVWRLRCMFIFWFVWHAFAM